MNTVFNKSISAWIFFAAAVAALPFVPDVCRAQSFNTATGLGALEHNTTGICDTADGDGALLSNTTGYDNSAVGLYSLYSNVVGIANSAIGMDALYSNTTGNYNTANGFGALFNNNASSNTATGYFALRNNSTGALNTALGLQSMYGNTTGSYNTAAGIGTLYSNTYGSENVALGVDALYYNTVGTGNVALGYQSGFKVTGINNITLGSGAGDQLTSGNNNVAIANSGASSDTGVIRIGMPGVQTQTFVSGIAGTGITGGIPVYITSNGQLGVIRSSARFKYDVHNIGSVSDKLMDLRPVTFRYKDADQDGTHSLQYGLIAEEVAKVYPDLVQYDKQGKPFTVYYHLLTPIMLDQLQKAHHQLEAQQTEFNSFKSAMLNTSSKLQAQVSSLQQTNRTLLSSAFGLLVVGLTGAIVFMGASARRTYSRQSAPIETYASSLA